MGCAQHLGRGWPPATRHAHGIANEPSLDSMQREELVVGVAEGLDPSRSSSRGDRLEVDAFRGGCRENAAFAALRSAPRVSATLPWSANARSVCSGIVLITPGAISCST